MVYIFNNYPNIEVTNFYLDVISKGIENAGYAVEKIPFVGRKSNGKLSLFRNLLFHDFGYKKLPKKAWIVVANPADAVNLRIHGYTNIILWAQGVSPEESYMTNGSMISKLFLEIIEKLSLNFSRFTFLVSNAMKEHYEKKYKIDFGQSCFIMPCFNSTLDLQSFEYPQKYENNIFTYVGSTAAWQCFKETISLYKQVEDSIPHAELRLFTSSFTEANRICEEYGVKNYSIDFVQPDELANKLKECKFGFVIRENNIVNNVATPTKLSSYMASGVMPILTTAIKDFSSEAEGMRAVCILDSLDDSRTIINKASEKITSQIVRSEYVDFFAKYYDRHLYEKRIGELLRDIL